MANDPHRRLVEQRRLAVHEAAERLAADPDADVTGLLERIEIHDKLLAAIPKRKWEWAPAATVAVLCLAALAVLWSVRLPTTSISLVVDAETTELRLADAWSWSDRVPVGGARVSLSEWGRIDLPPINELPARIEQHAWLDIDAAQATLSSLALGADSVFTIEHDGHEISLFGKSADFAGELSISGAATMTGGSAAADVPPRALSLVAEAVAFAAGGSAVPARLVFDPQTPLSFTDLHVDGVRFGREVVDESQTISFVSTITGGNLMLGDTGATVALERGGRLMLERVVGRVREIRIADTMTVAFDGRAERVLLGPDGAEADLTPSLLDYLYHNSRLGFFWSSAVFIWGMLWSLRKLLFA